MEEEANDFSFFATFPYLLNKIIISVLFSVVQIAELSVLISKLNFK